METIFEHNPTKSELNQLLGITSKEIYLEELVYAPKGENLLFIALLYEIRKDDEKFKHYVDQVPELYQQWQWGLDFVISQ